MHDPTLLCEPPLPAGPGTGAAVPGALAARRLDRALAGAASAFGVLCVAAALVAGLAVVPVPEPAALLGARVAALGVACALALQGGRALRTAEGRIRAGSGALLAVAAFCVADRWSACAVLAAGVAALDVTGGGARASRALRFLAVWTAADLCVETALGDALVRLGSSLGLAIDGHAVGAGFAGAAPLAAALAAVPIAAGGGALRRTLCTLAALAAWAAAFATLGAERAWLSGLAPCAAGLALCAAMPAAARGERSAGPAGRLRALAAVAAGAAAACALAPRLAGRDADEDAPRRVLVLNEGGLDWLRPNYEKMGAFDGGMFGLLPAYLAEDGIALDAAPDVPSFLSRLDGADAAMLINCPHVWSPGERARIGAFLASGRGVLVLGDHTDVFGLQSGFGSLLAEHGIGFRFDSAHDMHGTWTSDAIARPGTAWAADMHSLRHGVGASLEVRPPARSLVVGRFGFSDGGVRENSVGSMLGNYAVDAGESVGDVTLVAESAGGRLVVYGDTSAFQNGSMPESYPRHVLPLFRELVRREGRMGPAPVTGLLLAASLAAILLLARRGAGRTAACAGLCAGAIVFGIAADRPPPRATTARHAVVDLSCANLEGHHDAGVNDLGPLILHVERFGLLPVMARSSAEPGAERLRVVPAPAALSAPAAAALRRFAEDGGALVVAAGSDSGPGVRDFASSLGLELGEVIGAFPEEQRRRDAAWAPRLRRASRLVLTDPAWQPLLEQDGSVGAAIRSLGRGTVVWIPDPLFFGGPNVEGLWGSHPGNVRFVRRILERVLRTDPDEVQPVFDSPRKPS